MSRDARRTVDGRCHARPGSRLFRWRLLIAASMLALPVLAKANTDASQARLQVQWRTPLVDPPAASWKPREHGGVLLSPSGSVLFAPSATGVAALDAASGRIAWRLTTTERVDARPVLRGTHLYVATSNGTVHALDARTGAAEWPTPAKLDAPVQSPDDRRWRLFVRGHLFTPRRTDPAHDQEFVHIDSSTQYGRHVCDSFICTLCAGLHCVWHFFFLLFCFF